jgi:hypothetical protein
MLLLASSARNSAARAKVSGDQRPASWLLMACIADGRGAIVVEVDEDLVRLKRIYNFLCSMLVYAPFALCFVTLYGVFMHFSELTY